MILSMYVLKRILWMIPTLIGIFTITFFLTKLRPDPISQQMMGPDGIKDTASLQKYADALREYYGDNLPLTEQYYRLGINYLTFDFGESRIDQRQVSEKIAEALPYTIALNVITIFIVYIISVPLGIYSALNENSIKDRIITFTLYVLYSLPIFWVALLLVKYLAGGDYLGFFPIGGWVSDSFDEFNLWEKFLDLSWHLFLPVVVSVYGSFAFLSRFVKSSFMESLTSEYIRTAKAKGLSSRRVVYIHALRNSMIPLVTLMAGLLPSLFGGSVIVEKIFSIPGMGKLAYDSIYMNDVQVIMAVVFISALLTMFGILLSDIMYTLIDPRISFDKKAAE